MQHQAFLDLRTALDLLKANGELSEVSGEVNWDVELGAVTREVLRRRGPALLFSNITGYRGPQARCSRLATGLFASFRRISLMLGFDQQPSNRALIEYVLKKNATLVPPVLVEDGPVHENVLTGDAVDLFAFPVPRWHHLDGGRYIGTMGCVVTRDPQTRQVNVGLYRSMIVDRNRMGTLIVSSQGWGGHWGKYREMKRPMPVAFVFGWDPVMEFVAGSPLPATICEYDVMGGYRGAPVPLVKCRTVELEVPAAAELVVEGTISDDPATYAPEGPFGEYTGHVSEIATPRPVVKVSAITHRDRPIFRGTLEGSLPGASGENSYMSSIQRAAIACNVLRNAGIPGILDVFVHPVNNGTTVIVQIKKHYEGQPKQIAAALWGSNASSHRYKFVVVVDDDIDPGDYEAVDWAINYRVDPGSDDIVVFRSTFGSALDPSTLLEHRQLSELGAGLWNRMLIDATRTWRFPRRPQWGGERFPPLVTPRPQDLELVRKRWREYGFAGWKAEF